MLKEDMFYCQKMYSRPTCVADVFSADFGLSKIIDSEIQTQTVCGTPGYCCKYFSFEFFH